MIEVSHSSLSKLERGETLPMRKTKIALAKALGDNFGDATLDEFINAGEVAPPSKKEIVENMSAREFVSLKMGGKNGRRTRAEIDALTTMLDAEIERMKREEELYGNDY